MYRAVKLLFLVFTIAGIGFYIHHHFSLVIFPKPQLVEAQTQTTDWPQLQHDPQRTGYNNSAIRSSGTFTTPWSWHPANADTSVAEYAQPVIANGVLAIGDFDGVMYGLNDVTGVQLWQYPSGSPIYATAAIYNGKVFFGNDGGKVIAINASDGKKVWEYQTGAGVVSAPVAFNNKVFFTSKDGKLYAFNESDGTTPLWSYDAGAPITMSPAASVNKNTIFVGSENMMAYAINVNTHQAIWSKQLNGDGFRYYWPVVSESNNLVYFRTEPARAFHDMLNADGYMLESGKCSNFTFGECHATATTGSAECSQSCQGFTINSTEADYQTEQQRIVSYINANPDRQVMYALNLDTGNPVYTPAVLYTGGSGFVPDPPVINDVANQGWIIWRSYYSMYDSGTTVRPYVDVGKFNIATGYISHLSCPHLSGESCKMNWEDFHLVGDEQSLLTLAANAVLVGNGGTELGGIYTSTERSFNVGTRSGGGAGGNPVGVVANGRVYYQAGSLGMFQ
ncbi:TPA: hypothetical protein DIV55_01210 [Patescibacteria group bacterium]|nr:hypothetical protein [Patescibacteria group bacterium]